MPEGSRPWAEIARQPAFIVAVLAAAIGYGTMNLLMAATPLAMDVWWLGFGDVASCCSGTLLGNAPSFFTGTLIRRVGALPVLLAQGGADAGAASGWPGGVSLLHFWWALFLLGIGWNFLYIGGPLAHRTYRAERAMVQGSNDFALVFAVQAVSSRCRPGRWSSARVVDPQPVRAAGRGQRATLTINPDGGGASWPLASAGGRRGGRPHAAGGEARQAGQRLRRSPAGSVGEI